MDIPRVFIDTNVLKFSATELPRYVPRQTCVQWGDRAVELTVHDIVQIDPNKLIENPELKTEADMLRPLADLGKLGSVKYVIDFETLAESWGLRNMDSERGNFYGAPIEKVKSPVTYGRVVAGGDVDPREHQYQFLRSLNQPRFLEVQKITGAYQGKNPPNRNQLLDAYHLWSADHSKCDYFLTLDFKLIKTLNRSPTKLSVRAVRPSELVAHLDEHRVSS